MLVQKSVPLTLRAGTKGSTISVSPLSDDAFPSVNNKLDEHPRWEYSIIHRLIQKLKETCASEEVITEYSEDSWSTELATLIILLHKTRVDAVLLELHQLQWFKEISNGPCVIAYTLASHSSTLVSLKFVQAWKSRVFTGPELVLKAVSYVSDRPPEDVQSAWHEILTTPHKRKIYVLLQELCNEVLNNGSKK